MKPRPLTALASLLLLAALTACGATVKPIDLHDPVVPLDSRRLVADGQDAISIARARLDDARLQLKATEGWQWDIVNTNSGWPADSSARNAYRRYADSRLQMARLRFDYARTQLELAEAKYELTCAQTAIRHDLAVYELEPLIARTEDVRKRLADLKAAVEAHQRTFDQDTSAWWQAYATFAKGGGDTRPMFADGPAR